MSELKNMKLSTKLYKVKNPQEVHSFDWLFVLPIIEELNRIKKKYYLIYSHYTNDKREEAPAINYLRFRLIGYSEVIEHFKKIESDYIKKLGYEIDNDEFSFELLRKKYNINEKEIIELIDFWDKAARLKIELIKSWKKGYDTHYALNTLGFVGINSMKVTIDSKTLNIAYPEEDIFVNRNFPNKDK